MSKKAALVITTVLTVFVLVMTFGLVARLSSTEASVALQATGGTAEPPAPASAAPGKQPAIAPLDPQVVLQREQTYRQRLNEANALLAQANEQMQKLQGQNAGVDPQVVLQREQTYRQRLEEANGLLAKANDQLQQVQPQAQNVGLDPQVALQREQTYRQRLEEANALLTKAKEQLQQLQSQNGALLQREQLYQQRLREAAARLAQQAQAPAPPAPPQPPQPSLVRTAMISAQQAAAIATRYMGGGNAREVDLEREHGVTAYKVKVGSTKVFVDAYTGEVIVGGASSPTVRDVNHARSDDDD
ncbi:MAG: PepSY domain-containing protein [Chloroflexi bacterium]|nr:PepSY domain-containing protein [Chloroflexota bacterium]